MKQPEKFLVFDVESIGVHGEGFAVGYVVIDINGKELESGMAVSFDQHAIGIDRDREWVIKNVIPALKDSLDPPPTKMTAFYEDPKEVRDHFWKVWLAHNRQEKCMMAADCPWPVEARFLNQCVDDFAEARRDFGPYPLIDITSMIFAAGKDPVESFGRLTNELPEHNPLADSRQSARLLVEFWRRG